MTRSIRSNLLCLLVYKASNRLSGESKKENSVTRKRQVEGGPRLLKLKVHFIVSGFSFDRIEGGSSDLIIDCTCTFDCEQTMVIGIEGLSYTKIDQSSSASTSSMREELVEEPAGSVVEDKIFVALGKEVKESMSVLIWALRNSGGKKICIIHVHQPSQTISMLGGRFPLHSVTKKEVIANRKMERQAMVEALDEYVRICALAGVEAEKLFIERDSIEKGVVELIWQLRIGKLVMGAASNRRCIFCFREVKKPKSAKAIYVQQEAPAFCHIWFIGRGHLISMREGIKNENLYSNEWRQRKEIERALIKVTNERDKISVELQKALECQSLLESEIEALNAHAPKYFSEFSFSEIEKATNYFDPSMTIGKGGYGCTYRGYLRGIEVAVKMPHPDMSSHREFQQEVDVLSKLRHPNLVTLMGICPERWALIYEYLPNGSLEDRLNCKDGTLPLPWQTRVRIAIELCSVIVFLHSNRPFSIVHGDLKPANILLDKNFLCKLGDCGISHAISNTAGNTTRYYRTDNPMGTFAYVDPEFISTGELTLKSDIFAFGIILLRLLTGMPAMTISTKVQFALDNDDLNAILDPLAGDWPFVLAKQLAYLALRCCRLSRRDRPDLVSDVWWVLEPMRASFGSL
ncbi:hypothetical protein Nepgr_024306 [Nepenthes gracilis]|uniref:RING-type E3 ubiquitin transferase n=1 Tax=Nepenthes gracilis TaxID=150966 RepID=A0AAD3T3R0_NEPGR|nr:hypothetical protein Nepgr_024306 [Nepenthes gracilis]